MYAIAPLPSRAMSTLPTATTSALGPSMAVAGNQSACALAGNASNTMNRAIKRRGKTTPGRGAPIDPTGDNAESYGGIALRAKPSKFRGPSKEVRAWVGTYGAG